MNTTPPAIGQANAEPTFEHIPRITLRATRNLAGYSVECRVNAMPGETDEDAYGRLVEGMNLLETKYPAKQDKEPF